MKADLQLTQVTEENHIQCQLASDSPMMIRLESHSETIN